MLASSGTSGTRPSSRTNRADAASASEHCEFWRAVVEKAFGSFEQLDVSAMLSMHKSLARERYTPMLMLLNRVPAELLGELPRAYEDALGTLYRAIREVAGKSVVVDSSREVAQALVLARIPSIDLRVLHIVRDSRAVAFSNSRRKPLFPLLRDDNASQHRKPVSTSSAKLAFDEDGTTRIMPRPGAVASALWWTWRNAWASAIPHLDRRPIPYTRLRYEDLVRDPREAIAGVFEQLELGEADLSLIHGPNVKLRVNHALNGNPVKFNSRGVDLRIDDEWRGAMRERDRKLVSVITSPLMRRYGYVI